MFDTIGMYLDRYRVSEEDIERTWNRLDERTATQSERGACWRSGCVRSESGGIFHVTLKDGLIKLSGSISDFRNPSNFFMLTRKDYEETIEELSDVLGANVGGATITRLDIANNILTQFKPDYYYPLLISKRGFDRRIDGKSTLYFESNSRNRVLAIYDKMEHAKKKRIAVPDGMEGREVMRYELRLKRSPGQWVKEKELTCNMLRENKIYDKFVERWWREFDEIEKSCGPGVDISGCKTTKNAERKLLSMYLNKYPQDEKEFMNELRERGELSRLEYYRFNKKIKEVRNISINECTEEISPLDMLIKTIYQIKNCSI